MDSTFRPDNPQRARTGPRGGSLLYPLHRRRAPSRYAKGSTTGRRWTRAQATQMLALSDRELFRQIADTETSFVISPRSPASGHEAFIDAPVSELKATTRPVQHRGSTNRIGVELSSTEHGTRPLMTESRLEASAVRHWSWIRSTRCLAAHPVVLRFRLPDGTELTHVPDLLVEDSAGHRTLVNVKPRVFWDPVFALQCSLTNAWCEYYGLSCLVYSTPSRARIKMQELVRNHAVTARSTRDNSDAIFRLLTQPRSCHYLAHRTRGYGQFQPALMHLVAQHRVNIPLNSELHSTTRVTRGEPGSQDEGFVHPTAEIVGEVLAQQGTSESSIGGDA